jgi:hypothetical protein
MPNSIKNVILKIIIGPVFCNKCPGFSGNWINLKSKRLGQYLNSSSIAIVNEYHVYVLFYAAAKAFVI